MALPRIPGDVKKALTIAAAAVTVVVGGISIYNFLQSKAVFGTHRVRTALTTQAKQVGSTKNYIW